MFDFKAKLGPLPVWAWGLIFGGAVVGFYYWQQFKDDGSTESETPSANPATAEDMDSSDAIDGAFKPGTAVGSPLASPAAESTDTNSAWALRAMQALIGQGVSPITAQIAIGRYLDGETLDSAQADLVNRAIKIVGLPPEGATPVTPPAASASTIKSWRRLADGAIQVIMSDGATQSRSLTDYINAGMPAFTYNAYQTKVHRAASNSTTVAAIAAKYGTTVEDIMILNRWKSVPDLKKGQAVKVPDRKK